MTLVIGRNEKRLDGLNVLVFYICNYANDFKDNAISKIN